MRVSNATKTVATNFALQAGFSILSTIVVKYGTDAAMRGIEIATKRFKKKNPIGFVR